MKNEAKRDPKLTLTNRDIVELTAWRRKLHQHPEISNEEEKTAKEVVAFLADSAGQGADRPRRARRRGGL